MEQLDAQLARVCGVFYVERRRALLERGCVYIKESWFFGVKSRVKTLQPSSGAALQHMGKEEKEGKTNV